MQGIIQRPSFDAEFAPNILELTKFDSFIALL
jgi:hypothetical protein